MKEREARQKTCPLDSISTQGLCLGEKCMWWLREGKEADDDGECSVVWVADALREMTWILERGSQ